MKFTFRPGYALAALAIFLIEVAIALWVKDRFIRPYGGDVLATILVYLGIRAVTNLRVVPTAITALVISFMVEFAQAINVLGMLGWENNEVARTVLGTSFVAEDLVAYTAGAALAVLVERWRGSIQNRG